jgi:hypothetical protein
MIFTLLKIADTVSVPELIEVTEADVLKPKIRY